MKKRPLIVPLFVAALASAACGTQNAEPAGPTTTTAATTSTGVTSPFELAEFNRQGGCAKTVFVADESWTQVVEFRLGRVGEFEADVPIEFQVGDGVSVTLSIGEKLGNLFCNDFLEGDERIDSVYKAVSGSVIVTLDAPYPDQLDSGRVTASVVASDLVFETDRLVTIESLTASSPIGWYPG